MTTFQYFVVSQACIDAFLQHFTYVHDKAISKFEKKVLVVLGNDNFSKDNITNVLTHKTVKNGDFLKI